MSSEDVDGWSVDDRVPLPLLALVLVEVNDDCGGADGSGSLQLSPPSNRANAALTSRRHDSRTLRRKPKQDLRSHGVARTPCWRQHDA